MKNSLLVSILLMFYLANAKGQTDSSLFEVEQNYPSLETRKEKKEFRRDLADQYNLIVSKHFNVPCNKCWYMNVRGGYGWPFLTLRNEAPFDFLGNSIFVKNAMGEISDKVNYGTAGEGFRLGLGFGKMFNSFIGVEVFLNYNSYREVTLGSIKSPYYKSSLTAEAFDLSIMPQLVMQSPNLNNIYLYSKVGAIIPFYGYATIGVDIDDSEGQLILLLTENTPLEPWARLLYDLIGPENIGKSGLYNATIKSQTRAEFIGPDILETLRTIIGFTAAAGMKYQISPMVSVTGELRYTGFHVSLASNRVESLNGTISLLNLIQVDINEDDLPYGTFNIDYVKELTELSNNPDYNSNYDDSKASEDLPYRTSTSVLSFNIGIQVNIPNKKQRATNKLARE